MKVQSNLRFQHKYQEIIVFAVIFVVFAVGNFLGLTDLFRNLTQRAIQPLLNVEVSLLSQFRNPYESAVLVYTKSEYVAQLESQYAQALTQLAELQQLRSENKELRRMLNTTERSGSQKVIVGVPIVSLASPAVGVGMVDGVELGQMVLVDGILVGTITDVSQHQSKVLLLTQVGEKRVIAQTESGVEGILMGDGKNVLLTQVPRSAEIQEGELVLTSGQEGIQRGVAVGVVRSISSDPADASQTLQISQLISFYEAVLVEIR